MAGQKQTFKDYLFMHITFLVYSFVAIAQKIAGGVFAEDGISLRLVGNVLIVLAMLFVYAILWQQVLKRFPLAKAYPNKGVTVIWALIWAVIFFGETITIENVIGSAIIILGIAVISRDDG
ncbi:MAG: EamA family transporter [Christensenellaceae bacterium]